MSNVYALGVIALLFIVATFFLFHVIFVMNKKTVEVVAGVFDGVPVTIDFRVMTLFQINTPALVLVAGFAFIIGFGFLQFAEFVVEPDITRFAQLCAGLFFTTSLATVILGPAIVISIGRFLQRCAQDPLHMKTDARISEDGARRAVLGGSEQ